MSREIKLVKRGTLQSDDDARMIENYLADKLGEGNFDIYSYDSERVRLQRELSAAKQRIAELEAEEVEAE